MIKQIFGLPFFSTHISPDSYAKRDIITKITNNYNISKDRNKWEGSGSLHHSYNDEENLHFEKIDYSSIQSIYEEIIIEFLRNLSYTKEPKQMGAEIVNYTALSSGQHMASHVHNDGEFSAIHYISLDKDHTPIVCENKQGYLDYLGAFKARDLTTALDEKDINNSWIFRYWTPNISEDDFIIFPSVLHHAVPEQLTNKLRIAIVLNIALKYQ